jgi:hypothetical protein
MRKKLALFEFLGIDASAREPKTSIRNSNTFNPN